MKRIFFRFILILIGLYLAISVGNDKILSRYTEELKRSELNGNYEILCSDEVCGKLIGNGNGMQYFSAMLIKAENELRLNKNSNDDWEGVFLSNIEGDSYEYVKSEYGDYLTNINEMLEEVQGYDIETKSLLGDVNYYILYSFYNAPLESIWNSDLRGH